MYVLSESNETFDAEMQNFDVKHQMLRCTVRKNLMQIIKSQQGQLLSEKKNISVHNIFLFLILGYTYLLRNNRCLQYGQY